MTRNPNQYLVNFFALILAAALSVAVGSVVIPPGTLARILLARLPGALIQPDWPETFSVIVFQVRVPHTALILLAGAALGSSGAAYQGLFRNPLADPYLIGVASGAGLGAVLAMSWQWQISVLGLYAVPAAAFIGALLTVTLVYFLARVGGAAPTANLILAGVAGSAFMNALTSFLMLGSNQEIRRALNWLLGGGSMSGWQPVLAMLPYLIPGATVLMASGHALNVLQFGDEQAQQMGLPVERSKVVIIAAASLTAASAVAFAGIIGFIGLIVPHVIRMVWGPDYRQIIPLSFLGGGVSLLLADFLARTVLAPQVLPVGIVTALAGAPFFLWVLRRAKSGNIG
ncbi:MAG TPA: iron chelate uptake ABC transporter family permease subunit [Anaerolineaceae bacterium]|nr:iron chelate uptake ABC transporter family permease subunit [Anaerolineaceae bacterium]